MTDNARKTGAAVEAHFQFLMWLVPPIEKFPRTRKFLLGDRIQTNARPRRAISGPARGVMTHFQLSTNLAWAE
jgi:hypothetical protein